MSRNGHLQPRWLHTLLCDWTRILKLKSMEKGLKIMHGIYRSRTSIRLRGKALPARKTGRKKIRGFD